MSIVPALMPVIKEVTLAVAAASVEITVPKGYEILFLEWHDVYGDNAANQIIKMTFNSDTGGNYDYSRQPLGSASSTTNGGAYIDIGLFGDTDAFETHENGFVTIFNRASQEKVSIGSRVGVTKGDTPEDLYGHHSEGKWRNTSAEISVITLTPSVGNFVAGDRFILRGIRTDRAPALGSRDIVQFIGSVDLSGSSVTLPTIPAGYGMLWLFWHDIYGDRTDAQALEITFNGDTGGNYDDSVSAFGSASSTNNAASGITTGVFGDTDDLEIHSSGYVVIFNRASQEKVVVGSGADYDSGGATDEDFRITRHFESKWRNTSAEISTVTLAPHAANFAGSGKAWLFGVKIP